MPVIVDLNNGLKQNVQSEIPSLISNAKTIWHNITSHLRYFIRCHLSRFTRGCGSMTSLNAERWLILTETGHPSQQCIRYLRWVPYWSCILVRLHIVPTNDFVKNFFRLISMIQRQFSKIRKIVFCRKTIDKFHCEGKILPDNLKYIFISFHAKWSESAGSAYFCV